MTTCHSMTFCRILTKHYLQYNNTTLTRLTDTIQCVYDNIYVTS